MTVNAILGGQLAVQDARKIMMTFVVTAILRKNLKNTLKLNFAILLNLQNQSYNSLTPKERMQRDLVSVIIEKTLLDISKETCSLVEKRLFADFYCRFSDCYSHPEHLNTILKEIFGNNYYIITDKIKAEIEKQPLDKKLTKFIEVLVR